MPLRFFINEGILIEVRHRRTCSRVYVLKALSSAHLCDSPEVGLSADLPAESCKIVLGEANVRQILCG